MEFFIFDAPSLVRLIVFLQSIL